VVNGHCRSMTSGHDPRLLSPCGISASAPFLGMQVLHGLCPLCGTATMATLSTLDYITVDFPFSLFLFSRHHTICLFSAPSRSRLFCIDSLPCIPELHTNSIQALPPSKRHDASRPSRRRPRPRRQRAGGRALLRQWIAPKARKRGTPITFFTAPRSDV
jgi:hypothetical protein